jgi:putative transposase
VTNKIDKTVIKKLFVMANTYSQIHLQFVIVTKYRAAFIHHDWEEELYKYIAGIVQNDQNKGKVLAINGMPDHTHILVGMRPHISASALMQEVKASSSRWINDYRKTKYKFEWQNGFAVFAYSKSHVQNVINYIRNQKSHHAKKAFKDEYLEMLRKNDVQFDEKYIFHDPQ